MAIYFILCGIYFVVALYEINKSWGKYGRKIICLLMLIPLYILTAFRSVNVGTDTLTYYNAFNYIIHYSSILDAIHYSRMEAGYVVLNYIVGSFGGSFLTLQIIISSFIYISVFRFILNNSQNIGLSCFLFLTLRMFCGPMNTVREWIAIAILLFAIHYICQRKFIRFLLMVIAASLFHFTALIFLVMYPLYAIKRMSVISIGAFFASCVVVILGNTFFSFIFNTIGRYEGYLNTQYFAGGINIATVISIFVTAVFMVLAYCTKTIELFDRRLVSVKWKGNSFIKEGNSETDKLFSIMMVLYTSLIFVGIVSTIMSRVASYFIVSILIVIPHALNNIKNKSVSFIVMILIASICVVYFYLVLRYRPGWNGINNFSWYFQ